MEKVRKLGRAYETTANATVRTIKAMNAETSEIHQVVLQNSVALDYILTSKSSVCVLIRKSCCTKIKDKSPEVKTENGVIEQAVSGLHKRIFSWDLWSWVPVVSR